MPSSTQKPPNIILITSDQHRGDSLGCTGHPCVQTPHLDLLARQGIVFDQAYVNCPVCIPARTSLVTGIHAHNYGCPNYKPEFRIGRERDLFLGSLISQAGYQTHLVGKTHWHTGKRFRAGFETVVNQNDRYREMERAGVHTPSHGIGANEFNPTLSRTPPQYHDSNWTITKSIEFLENRDEEQPFFLWTSMIDPHPPNAIHEPFYSMYDNEEIPDPVHPLWAADEVAPFDFQFLRSANGHANLTPSMMRKARGVYYGQITNMDHQLGRLFAALQRSGEWDNTLVIYTSDHGDCLGDYGTFFKSNFTDGACRVPMVIRPPRDCGTQLWGTHSDALVEWADLLPTFCELAGASTPNDIDGKSMVNLFSGSNTAIHSDLHGQIGAQHMYHDGRYKYLYFEKDGKELIFDKQCDPLDETDLSNDSALLARLRAAFITHLKAENNSAIDEEGKLITGSKAMEHGDSFHGMGWMGLQGTLRNNGL